jgi:putative flippase GtrA
MLIDFGLTYLLKEKIKTNKYVANSVGFIAAATSNFYFNKYWTFQSTSDNVSVEFVSFLAIGLLGLVINNVVIYLLTERYKNNFYLSKFVAICAVTFWNFIMNYLFTFSQ